MFPEKVLSTKPVIGAILAPKNQHSKDGLIDYDYGPIAINDLSKGLMCKYWRGFVKEGDLYFEADDVKPFVVTHVGECDHISITFDQNARPCVAYANMNSGKLFWFDPVENRFNTLDLGATKTPHVCLDDKRDFNIQNSDIVLVYINGSEVYTKLQRDRFTVAYAMGPTGGTKITAFGMSSENRMQIETQ